MIAVSDAWKEAYKQKLLPETFVEITMNLANTDVLGVPSGTNESDLSYSSRVLDNGDYRSFEKYAFLEENSWLLDGSRSIISQPESYRPPAFLSDKDGECSLTIKLTTAQTTTIPGFTITWSTEFDTYATDFSLEVKNGNTVVATTRVTNNDSRVSMVMLPVSSYDSLKITVHEWCLPNQRSRIDAVMFGCKVVFTKNEIIEYSHEQSGSPLGTEITQNTIEFTVDNSDGLWDMYSFSGLSEYLFERQKLTVRYGLDVGNTVEWINAGIFYLSDWRVPSNGITATFKARDLVEFMLDAKYSRAYWEGTTTASVPVYDPNGNQITTLSRGKNVRVYRQWIHSPSVGGEPISPESTGLMMYTIDEGVVQYDNIQITTSRKLLYDVTNAFYSCVPILENIAMNNAISTYESPVSVEETGVGEFLQQCAASCGLTMWQGTDGTYYIDEPDSTLTDYEISLENAYGYPEIELTKPLRQIDVVYRYQYHDGTNTYTTGVSNTGETMIIDCPFVWKNSSRAAALAKKYNDYWYYRQVVSGEFRADPRLQLFDRVTVIGKNWTMRDVVITKIKYTYNGAFRGTYEGKRVL